MDPLPQNAGTGAPAAPLTKDEVESRSFTVPMLKTALATLGLPTKGRKAELRARLLEALEEDEVSCSVQTSRSASNPSTP